MKTLSKLFDNNKLWASLMAENDPEFFKRLSDQQSPKYLWIGCSDSRVPANQITGLDPGEVFVHRNVGNLVIHTDLNCLSVIQYAVEILNVSDIVVCGHYGCGGINAALAGKNLGLIDNWIRNIKDVYQQNIQELQKISDAKKIADRLCELNVIQQVHNVCHSSIIQNYWDKGASLNIHGWIYGLNNGRLKDLDITISSADQLDDVFQFND